VRCSSFYPLEFLRGVPRALLFPSAFVSDVYKIRKPGMDEIMQRHL
jgi:hypothetical protein